MGDMDGREAERQVGWKTRRWNKLCSQSREWKKEDECLIEKEMRNNCIMNKKVEKNTKYSQERTQASKLNLKEMTSGVAVDNDLWLRSLAWKRYGAKGVTEEGASNSYRKALLLAMLGDSQRPQKQSVLGEQAGAPWQLNWKANRCHLPSHIKYKASFWGKTQRKCLTTLMHNQREAPWLIQSVRGRTSTLRVV